MRKKLVQKNKPPLILVFAEDENDANSIISIARCANEALPTMKFVRSPPILVRDQKVAAERKRNAEGVLGAVRARRVKHEVMAVIAHQDCDNFEPAHVPLCNLIENELTRAGIPNVVPVAPAWEIEAWWFLWPEAVARVNSDWAKLKRKGNHGLIKDAKETLRRDLRKAGKHGRDYEESDSQDIAENVREMGIFGARIGSSSSLDLFVEKLGKLKF